LELSARDPSAHTHRRRAVPRHQVQLSESSPAEVEALPLQVP
jgi:hypothetical protein